jgi:hypothetical protein
MQGDNPEGIRGSRIVTGNELFCSDRAGMFRFGKESDTPSVAWERMRNELIPKELHSTRCIKECARV